MNLEKMKELSAEIENEMPWLKGLNSHEEYQKLISLLDELVENYEDNKRLIDLMWPVLHSYEENSEYFKAFNERIALLTSSQVMIRVILDQNSLTTSDLSFEIGTKEQVEKILTGHDKLTDRSIKALSKRFAISEIMFE
ncbi:hypothetical protein [Moritella viscosa]|uniref:Transcriptional regulator n=1 Tax=Moritella viscosa TaxID=80854 RepID=A0ABY1HAW0_9GAMM|nr:hypothetical protein [Moritella viscosa]SGY85516.1 Putative transcriptional regulator [Moritella viscosa]SGZ09135.1 Putative transcriptional regulator [Moritella viscosa]SHO28659.1 Putative transcriptional regulator [Moritella viscosa]